MEWKIGLETNFTVSIGKSGKYIHRWLKKDIYALPKDAKEIY